MMSGIVTLYAFRPLRGVSVLTDPSAGTAVPNKTSACASCKAVTILGVNPAFLPDRKARLCPQLVDRGGFIAPPRTTR
jgi:hypothetical protein